MQIEGKKKIQLFSPVTSSRDAKYRKYVALKRVKLFLICAIILVVVALLIYWAGNGFSFNVIGESNTFYVNIDTPAEGSTFYAGEDISLTGGVVGDTINKVVVWDTEYNVGVGCANTVTKWGVTLRADDLSPGIHILAVQAQGSQGEWSPVSTIQITIKGNVEMITGHMSDNFGPFAPLFRPVEDLIGGLTAGIEQGTGDNDLNGDNINDAFEKNPVSPRYNPFNMPMTYIIVIAILCILIYLLVRYSYRYFKRRQLIRASMTKRLMESPTQRDWYLRLKALTNQQLKSQLVEQSSRYKAEYSRLEAKLLRIEEEKRMVEAERERLLKQKPVKIMISPTLKPKPTEQAQQQSSGIVDKLRRPFGGALERSFKRLTTSSVDTGSNKIPLSQSRDIGERKYARSKKKKKN